MNKSRKKKKKSNLLATTTGKRRLRRPFPNFGGFSAWRVGADTAFFNFLKDCRLCAVIRSNGSGLWQ